MDKEQNESMFSAKLLRNFGTIFTFSILSMTIAARIVTRFSPEVKNLSTLFTLGEAGLSFNTILQIAGFSLLLDFFMVLIFSEIFIKNMRFLRRTVHFSYVSLLTLSVFSLVFKWFPANDPLAWLGFILSTIICFAASIGLTLLKLKLEGKKYNRLLANYKAQYKINRSNINYPS